MREDIRDEKKNLMKHLNSLKTLDSEGNSDEVLGSSEFGMNSVDMEMIHLVKESGGFSPLLRRKIEEASFSWIQTKKSFAKLALLGYIHLPENGLKITLASQTLDIPELPRITFATKVPEDVSLMLVHANILYRSGKFDDVVLKCYNILERTLKTHLIPSIDDYVNKWNVTKKESWNGTRTEASLNSLWNFYKKNANLSKNWV